MTAIPLPLISAPGRHPQASGGRLINCYPEKMSPTAGPPYVYPRVPGLALVTTTPVVADTNFRGGLFVGSTLYFVMGAHVYSLLSDGTLTQFTNTVVGTSRCFLSRNNAQPTPHIVVLVPGSAVYLLNTSTNTVGAYPDADANGANAVDFLKGLFVFTFTDGTVRHSDVNSTNINSLSFANAESKPDTLYRPIPLGNGQLLLCGSNSMEVWGGANATGFAFNYIATINRGIIGQYAIAGSIDGFGKGLFWVADDSKVYTLDGYQPKAISSSDVELRIERDANKILISVGVYVANGHGFVVVQGTDWCWEYETDLGSWHERQSYLNTIWRGTQPVMAWKNEWYCGDFLSARILKISGAVEDECGNPLRKRIETGPIGGFPKILRINSIELYCTKGTGIATGTVPTQTNPRLGVSISKDGGQTWGAERILKIGEQALTVQRVRSSIWGQAEVQGVRWRIDETSNVPWSVMGLDMDAEALR